MDWPQPTLPVSLPTMIPHPIPCILCSSHIEHTLLFLGSEHLCTPLSTSLLPLIQQAKHLLRVKVMQAISIQFEKYSNQYILQHMAGIQNEGRSHSL